MKNIQFSATALLLTIALFCTSTLSAQWSQNSASIWNTNLNLNLGIGTNTPSKKLHVNGGFRVEKEVSVGGGNIFEVDATGVAGGRFKIAANGNVGIGTANPTAKLQVQGTIVAGPQNSTDEGGELQLSSNFPNPIWALDAYKDRFRIHSGGTEKMTVLPNGKMGLGTAAPMAKLHIGQGNLHVDTGYGIEFGDQSSFDHPHSKIWEHNTDGHLIIRPGGYDGFPEGPVPGYAELVGSLYINGSDDAHQQLKFGAPYSGEGIGSNRGSSSSNGLVFYTANQNRLYITNSGNVGIGTTAPAYKLDVDGSIRCNGSYYSSDRRYKTNIQTLGGAMGKIMAMRGTSYDFNAEHLAKGFPVGKQVGFIAQDMQNVMPELVKADDDGMLAVNYVGVIPVLVEALKEQHEVIAEKETRIAALEAQNTELQSRLARIEAALGIAADRQTDVKTEPVSAKASPNPTSGLVNIDLQNTATAKSVVVNIVDATGRQVAARNAAGASSLQFDLSQLPAGVYVAQIVADGKMVSSNKVQLVK